MSTRKANRATALLESGLRQFQQGQVEQARQSCEQALQLAPRHPDAMHLLGVIALERGDPAGAVDMLRRAIAIQPDHANYQANLAYGHVGLKQFPEALAAFERAARLDPADPELRLGAGNCLAMMGRTAEAEAVFRRLVERYPQYALGWFNLAKALDNQQRYEEACSLYKHVTQLAPQFAEAYANLGAVQNRLERFEEAEQAFRACLARKPGFAPAFVNLAIALNHLRQHAEAEVLCRQALARDPDLRSARAMLGKSLAGQGRWLEAARCFAEAIKVEPGNPELLGYLGDALARTGRIREALNFFERALAQVSAPAHVRFSKAIALFAAGHIHEGAAAYAGREEPRLFAARHPGRALSTALPRDLRGENACLIGEQGIGDEIFFLRYAPQLRARGCRVTYHGNPKIVGMLARSALFDQALTHAEPFAAADHTVLVGDLPHLLDPLDASPLPPRDVLPGAAPDATVVAAAFSWHCRVFWPLLPPPVPLEPLADRVAAVHARLRQLGPPPYIGLTWRAGTDSAGQRGRVWQLFKEVPFQALAAALDDTAGTLISLQRNPRAGETGQFAALLGRPLHDFSASNDDLEEMLALLAVLDDYLGVSNTNMHLRAGIGKPARVLVPWPAEWRWMAAGDASPWFPGFRVYRQRQDGDWGEALARLRVDLAAKAR
jgi:tetratricopeptide (TPR) repeat protein